MTEPGRRSATRRTRLNPTALIGALLVAVTVGALLLVRPPELDDRAEAPAETPLTDATVACPASLGDAAEVSVASARESASGDVRVVSGGREQSVPLRGNQVTEVPDVGDPVTISAQGEEAPGLLASRFGDKSLAALDCPAPAAERWFTGVGGGAGHTSVIELVNPDDGPAVVDITVLGRAGPVEAEGLRGISVPGRDSIRLDLSEELPRRNELALHVAVSRGRVAASVLDVIPELGTQPKSEDWLTPVAEPALHTTLLGVPEGDGEDVLAVANPGEDEARVKLRILAADSAFAPKGVEELRVPPGTVRAITLTSALRAAVEDGALGIDVTGTVPVTASLRSVIDGDLSHAVPVTPSGEATTALVPEGTGRVVFADAEGVGTVTVTSFAADGKRLGRKTVEVRPGTGGTVDLPKDTALVRVSPERTAVPAAAIVTDKGAGAAVVPFRELVDTALVPNVRPGLP
jgi:hypothetical protein